MAAENKVKKVAIHCFLDGRDVPDRSAGLYIKKIEAATKKYGIGKIATLIGRYYAMDRDGNYDRTMVAYDMLVDAKGRECKDPLQAIAEEYKSGAKTDYYVNPIVIVNGNGVPIASLHRDDAAIFFNYRVDRAKQLTNAVKGRYFTEFPRLRIENLYFTCMSEFVGELRAPVAFRAVNAENNFGEVLSKNKIKQLRISETEKYAHVTYFFNSQVEKPYKGEERILVPSPKVPSYDMKPDMSAYEVTEKVLECLDSGKYGFVLLNYANCDLVGHSSVLSATIKAVEVVDECM
jgi:2,3-bisphosphoglycerate-independent phosphoglycerate mutase